MFKRLISNYLLFIAVFFGLVLRLISLDQSFWMDEAISAYAVKNFNYAELLGNFIKADTHPPFYYLILKFWSGLFGYSEVALRSLSVVFGILTIYAIHRLGNIIGKKTGVMAAFLTAFSPLLIYYSQEARMYSLSTLLVALSVYFFLKMNWISLSISLLFLGVTDYLPLIVLLPIWIMFIVDKRYRREARGFFLSHVPVLTFFVFWFPIFNIQRISTFNYLNTIPGWGDILGESNIKNLALVWVKFLIGRINFAPWQIYAVVVVGVSMLVFYGLYFSFKKYKITLPFILWLIIPIILSFVLSIKVPGFSYFRLLFTLPALIILLSCGFSLSKKGYVMFVVFIVLESVFSFIYLFNKNYWREDWKTAVPFIENRLNYNEAVFISYPETFTPYKWYSLKPDTVKSFNREDPGRFQKIYTLDYLMDLTSPEGANYIELKNLGFKNTEVYNFRGVGQVRYWVRM